MFHRGMRKACGLLLMVLVTAAIGVVAHADGPAAVTGGTVRPLCWMQWEGNFCP